LTAEGPKKTTLNTVEKNHSRVQREVQTGSVQAVADSIGHSDTEQQTVQLEVLKEIGQTVENTSEHSDTKSTNGTM
jgi:hypothetical protein